MKCILRRLRCRGGGAARARRGGLLRGRGEPLSTQAQGENGSPGGKYRILSGIQPTGKVHLGNYVGAVRNWVGLQTPEHETFYSIVDLHALTSGVTSNENESVASSSLETAATMLACGIDPTRSTVFRQSRVPAHCELMWVLACHTPLGWLNRMTQVRVDFAFAFAFAVRLPPPPWLHSPSQRHLRHAHSLSKRAATINRQHPLDCTPTPSFKPQTSSYMMPTSCQ